MLDVPVQTMPRPLRYCPFPRLKLCARARASWARATCAEWWSSSRARASGVTCFRANARRRTPWRSFSRARWKIWWMPGDPRTSARAATCVWWNVPACLRSWTGSGPPPPSWGSLSSIRPTKKSSLPRGLKGWKDSRRSCDFGQRSRRRNDPLS